MRTFLILICSIALACSATAAQKDNKSKKQAQKNRQAQPTQYARPAGGPKKATPKRYQPASTTASYQKAKGRQSGNNQVYQSRANVKPTKKSSQQVTTQNVQAGRYATKKTKQGQHGVNRQVYQSGSNVKKGKKGSQQIAAQNAQAGRYATSATYSKKTKQWNGNPASAAAFQSNAKKYKAQRFNLASNTRPTNYTAVKFQQNRRIWGSQNWQGQNYWASELQICVARQRLVAESLQPCRFRIWWMVLLEFRLVVSGMGIRSQCVLRLRWSDLCL